MIFFILFLAIGIWKIYAFLPNKQLHDDDKTHEAANMLQDLMIKVIKEKKGKITDTKELYSLIRQNEDFDKERFWRFNQNRLNSILERYFLQNPNVNNIEDIYNNHKED